MIVQLIEPDGTIGLKVTYGYALQWCKDHIGWSWQYCDDSI